MCVDCVLASPRKLKQILVDEPLLEVVLSHHPPIFSRAKDPLDVDDWLRTTESKFSLLRCTEYRKTLYAAQ
jgi:hypothetical protein